MGNSVFSEEGQNDQSALSADILIVDDVPDNIRFLSSFLIEHGYRVRKAVNSQMALTAIQALRPNLILLDVNLPDFSGYEICSRLKDDQTTQSIPIIFLSAGNETVDKVKAFKLGAADYITKPFYLEEVLTRIQTQLTIQGLQAELESQNVQLKDALEALKISQAHVVQQEKMATLRKVVAGVAHEVNNPLSFIACNVKPAQDYIQTLTTLLDLYQQHYPDPDPDIQDYLDTIDLEFISADVQNIIRSMGTGAERIRDVILALQQFIRLDEKGIKLIDVHESINNTLVFLQNRLTLHAGALAIEIRKTYGEIPPIQCYAAQLNQAIFNLLCNAVDAIEEKLVKFPSNGFQPVITITTQQLDDHRVSICIQDNGIGIPAQNQLLIFEPFFSTKQAGQGVGLGLATSRSIVEEVHRGTLTVQSSPEMGTEFRITLPIQAVKTSTLTPPQAASG